MVHVHRVDIARLNHVVVDLSCLAHNLHALTSVLAYDILGGWVDDIALNFAQFLWQVKPKLAPLVVVEVLLG